MKNFFIFTLLLSMNGVLAQEIELLASQDKLKIDEVVLKNLLEDCNKSRVNSSCKSSIPFFGVSPSSHELIDNLTKSSLVNPSEKGKEFVHVNQATWELLDSISLVRGRASFKTYPRCEVRFMQRIVPENIEVNGKMTSFF